MTDLLSKRWNVNAAIVSHECIHWLKKALISVGRFRIIEKFQFLDRWILSLGLEVHRASPSPGLIECLFERPHTVGTIQFQVPEVVRQIHKTTMISNRHEYLHAYAADVITVDGPPDHNCSG